VTSWVSEEHGGSEIRCSTEQSPAEAANNGNQYPREMDRAWRCIVGSISHTSHNCTRIDTYIMTARVYYVQINILLIGIEARGFTIRLPIYKH